MTLFRTYIRAPCLRTTSEQWKNPRGKSSLNCRWRWGAGTYWKDKAADNAAKTCTKKIPKYNLLMPLRHQQSTPTCLIRPFIDARIFTGSLLQFESKSKNVERTSRQSQKNNVATSSSSAICTGHIGFEATQRYWPNRAKHKGCRRNPRRAQRSGWEAL